MKKSYFGESLTLFAGSIFLALTGLEFHAMPLYASVPIVLLSGYNLISGYIPNKQDKWNEIFEACRIKNVTEQYPQLINIEKNKLGKRYIFSIPKGLSFNDFVKNKERIETALCEPLKLDLTHDYKVVMQIFDSKYKSVYTLNIGGKK